MLKLGRYRPEKYVQSLKLEAAIQERIVDKVHDLDKILLKQGF